MLEYSYKALWGRSIYAAIKGDVSIVIRAARTKRPGTPDFLAVWDYGCSQDLTPTTNVRVANGS